MGPGGVAQATDRPIVIAGCARSGTTMLQMMLDRHPRIAVPSETRFLIGLHRRRVQFGDLRRREALSEARDFVLRPESLVGYLPLEGSKVARAISRSPRTIGSVAGSVFEEYAKSTGKQRWGEKRPNHIRNVPRILEMFPDAQVVHIVRDGRDCVSSLLNVPWWEHGLMGAAFKWREAITIGAELRASLDEDQYVEVSYERLVRSPKSELRRLCDFLGEEFDAGMIQFHEGAEIASWRTWHEATTKPINDSAIGRWEADLDAASQAFVHHALAEPLRACGYDVPTDPPEPDPAMVTAWTEHQERRQSALQKRDTQERVRREQYGFPVQAALTSTQRRQAAGDGWLDAFDRPTGLHRLRHGAERIGEVMSRATRGSGAAERRTT